MQEVKEVSPAQTSALGDAFESTMGASDELTGAVATSEEQFEYLTTKKFIPVFVCMYFTLFLIALDRLIIATALPTITNEFHSLDDLQWYASAYMLTGSCFMLIFGRLYGFYPPKYVFLSCILVFEVGSAICGAAPSSLAFIWGRAIAGLGSAGAFSGGSIIIMHTVPMHKRPMYSGLLGSALGIASVMGPLIGGAFTSSEATWRWCFYINIPIGGIATLVILVALPNIPVPGGGGTNTWREHLDNLDPLGSAMFLPSMVCLVLALQWGGTTYLWSDGRVIALLVISGATFLIFIGIQLWKGESATVPPRIISYRSIAGGMWFAFCNGGAMVIMAYFLPVWFQAIQGASAFESGIRTLPLVLAQVVFTIGAGVLVRFSGYYTPLMYASTVVASIGAGFLTTFSVDAGEGVWIGYQVLYGAGLGMGTQQPSVAAQTVLSKKDIAVGSSILVFASQLGGSIFIAVAQNVFGRALSDTLGQIPRFDTGSIIDAGATGFQGHIPVSQLREVLQNYNDAIMVAFKVALALTCAGLLGVIPMEWKSTKEEKNATRHTEDGEPGSVA